MTLIRTLDELSPIDSAEEALSSPVGTAILIAMILLLIAAVIVIVIKVKKRNAKAEQQPAGNDSADGEAP